MTATRSATCRTTDRSWETSSRPMFSSRTRAVSRLAICAWAEASRALIGSSAIRHDGLAARVRAIAIRCRCPPLNSCGKPSAAIAGSPIRSSSSVLRARAEDRLPPARSTPSAMRSPTFRRGFSDSYGSWNTICSPRSRPGRWRRPSTVTGWPSKAAVPAARGTRPAAARASVDLPHPDSPTKPTISPRATVRSTPSRARMRCPWRRYSTAAPDSASTGGEPAARCCGSAVMTSPPPAGGRAGRRAGAGPTRYPPPRRCPPRG